MINKLLLVPFFAFTTSFIFLANAHVPDTLNYTAKISADELESKIQFLASDDMKGRMTGTEEAAKVADFAIAQYKKLGILPFNSEYKHAFSFTSGTEVNEANTYLSIGENSISLKDGFEPMLFSSSDEIKSRNSFYWLWC
jgi:hypothetical protein